MSIQYLLDTNICIYITKQKPQNVLKKFEEIEFGKAVMSIITYGELLFGAEKSQNAKKTKKILEELTSLIPPLPLTINVSEHYGMIRHELEKRGKSIGNNDLWIAAHALALNVTLVTNNTKEFARIPKLKVENWV